MPRFERAQVATLADRLRETPRRIVAVFGPRQTGKTIIIRQALVRSGLPFRYVAVDEPDSSSEPGFPRTDPFPAAMRDERWLVRCWEHAREQAGSGRGFVLAFDEIQKVPRWSEVIKGLWDADRLADRPLRVVIAGSSPMTMQQGLGESLAGRFETIPVAPWSFAEIAAAFGFDPDRYVFYGGYPGAAPHVGTPAVWRDYVRRAIADASIERDVLAMTRVDRPALLTRLFWLSSRMSGQIVAYNKMLGQLRDAGNTTTLARYLDLLWRVGLVAGLARYAGPLSDRGTSPKLNVLDTSLMTAASGYTFEEATADRTFWGRVVETAVGAHLVNTAEIGERIYYWRDDAHEVDFVIERGPKLAAVEVKTGRDRSGGRGLTAFRQPVRAEPHGARGARRHFPGGLSSRIPPGTGWRRNEGPRTPHGYRGRRRPLAAARRLPRNRRVHPARRSGSGEDHRVQSGRQRALGDDALCLPASDFLAFAKTREAAWSRKTLFIDGLDEVRAGSGDPRIPLNKIRRRLDALERPRFRLSCRAADWLGSDQERLRVVSPGRNPHSAAARPAARSGHRVPAGNESGRC